MYVVYNLQMHIVNDIFVMLVLLFYMQPMIGEMAHIRSTLVGRIHIYKFKNINCYMVSVGTKDFLSYWPWMYVCLSIAMYLPLYR